MIKKLSKIKTNFTTLVNKVNELIDASNGGGGGGGKDSKPTAEEVNNIISFMNYLGANVGSTVPLSPIRDNIDLLYKYKNVELCEDVPESPYGYLQGYTSIKLLSFDRAGFTRQLTVLFAERYNVTLYSIKGNDVYGNNVKVTANKLIGV